MSKEVDQLRKMYQISKSLTLIETVNILKKYSETEPPSSIDGMILIVSNFYNVTPEDLKNMLELNN